MAKTRKPVPRRRALTGRLMASCLPEVQYAMSSYGGFVSPALDRHIRRICRRRGVPIQGKMPKLGGIYGSLFTWFLSLDDRKRLAILKKGIGLQWTLSGRPEVAHEVVRAALVGGAMPDGTDEAFLTRDADSGDKGVEPHQAAGEEARTTRMGEASRARKKSTKGVRRSG